MSRATDHGKQANPADRPTPERAASSNVGGVAALQRAAGNHAVAAALAPLSVQRAPADAWKSEEDVRWEAKSVASQLETAMQDVSEEGIKAVLKLLSGHTRETSAFIETDFAALNPGKNLRAQLKWYFGLAGAWDDLVRAWALLRHPHYHDYHVAVALALIPSKTRDEELYRLLTAAAKGKNQRILRSEYDATFRDLGQGSLDADLKEDLEDEELLRANALMDHPLTEAEKLFLNFEGLKEEGATAIGIIEQAWRAGPDEFHHLKEDWDYLVVGKNEWTRHNLKQAFEARLPGWFTHEELIIAREIYTSYEVFVLKSPDWRLGEHLQRPGEGPGPAIPWEQRDWMLQMQINAEERLFRLHDPEKGDVSDKNKYLTALERLQTLTQQRIDLAKSVDKHAHVAVLELHWAQTKKALRASIEGSLDPGSDEYIRARLLAEGNLTPADKLWVKWKDSDFPGIIKFATECWAAGQMQRLVDGCGHPREVLPGLTRPGVPPLVTLVSGGRFGNEGEKVRTLAQPGDDVFRGRERLAHELDPERGRSDRNVKGAYEFLTTPGLKPEHRNAVIQDYVSRHVSPSFLRSAAEFGASVYLGIDLAPASPVEMFLDHLSSAYPNSNTVWNFYDLLAPTQDINEIVRRAEKRTLIATTGFSAGLAELFDVGGEDTLATTRESLERLQFLQQQGLKPDDIQLLLAMMGKTSTAQLVGVEYDMLKERVDAALAARKKAVSTFVSLLEFAVKTALTVMTAGAPLIADLGATVAGIIAQEMIEGDESDMLTEANLVKLVAPVAGLYTGKVSEALGEAEFWAKAGAIGPLLKGSAGQLVEQAGEKVVDVIFNPAGWPTTDDVIKGIASGLITSLSGAQAGIVADKVKGNFTIADDYITRAGRTVKAKLYSNVITQSGSMVAKIGTGAMDDKDLGDVFEEYTEGLTKAQGMSVIGGLIESRVSLDKARKEHDFQVGAPTSEGSVLHPLDGAPDFKPSDDAAKDRHVTLGSGTATVVMSDSGDAEIHVDTPFGRQKLRDVVISVRPPATADQAQRTKWAQLANKVVFLEHRAKDLDQSQLESELFEIALTVVWDLDPSKGSSGAAPLIGP